MTLESKVHLSYTPQRPFRFERFYSPKTGKKMWQAACQFDVGVQIDPSVDDLTAMSIEYRQFIRGGVWVRRGNADWTDDLHPNGNAHFPIPPYNGTGAAAGLPSGKVTETGLSLSWKEDGEMEGNSVERFGYRATANVKTANEIDEWTNPTQITGRTYRLRDTPSIAGEWGSGESVEVWIELSFKGFIVQVEQTDAGPTKAVRVLKQRDWSYFWPEQKLSLWMDATAIS